MKAKKKFGLWVGLAVAAMLILLFWLRPALAPITEIANQSQIATAVNTDELTETNGEPEIRPVPAGNEAATPLPKSHQLAVPFTPQAPHANWDLPYQEACEEASILMAARFLQGRGITDASDADSAILQLVEFGDEIGYPMDTTAVETAAMLEQFYGLKTDVVFDFTWDQVRQAIADGYPVIVPTSGRLLGNPNYTQPGPLYHMLVITGYTPDLIITNDPGTKNGRDYSYSYPKLETAIHDWNGGNVATGRRVMIVVRPN